MPDRRDSWDRYNEVRDLGRHPALRRVEVEIPGGGRVSLPRPAGCDAGLPAQPATLGARTDAIRREFLTRPEAV